jgi:RNA polymerase sigma-70 factor (sigma-E family)
MSRERAMMTDVAASEGSERSGLAETYVRSAPGAIRLGYMLTGDRALAEDLAQEAFVRFVARLHYIRDRHAVDAYLRQTIVNLSRNYFRRRAVERSFLERQARERQPEHLDPDISTHQAMRTALLGLPVRQRAALVLRYYEDLPEGQIADILRCRPSTVRSLVSRGLQALRQIPEVTR